MEADDAAAVKLEAEAPPAPPREGDEAAPVPVGVGKEGSEMLMAHLNGAADPGHAIRMFQEANSLREGRDTKFGAVLQLLGFMGQGPGAAHSALLGRLHSRLFQKLEQADEGTKIKLLEKMFPHISCLQLQEAVFGVISTLQTVPEDILRRLAQDPTLHPNMPSNLRRDMWLSQPDHFDTTTLQHLREFIRKDEGAAVFHNCHVDYLISLSSIATARHTHQQPPTDPSEDRGPVLQPLRRTDLRKTHALLQTISQDIAGSVELYQRALGLLKQQVDAQKKHKTRQARICLLRSQLVMSMQDQGMKAILNKDDVYRLTWLLDAAMADSKCLDHAVPLQKVLKWVHDYAEKRVEGDGGLDYVSMVLADRPVMWTLAAAVIASEARVGRGVEVSRAAEETVGRLCSLLHTSLDMRQFVKRGLSSLPEGFPDDAVKEVLRQIRICVQEDVAVDKGEAAEDTGKTIDSDKLAQVLLSQPLTVPLVLLYYIRRAVQRDHVRIKQLEAILCATKGLASHIDFFSAVARTLVERTAGDGGGVGLRKSEDDDEGAAKDVGRVECAASLIRLAAAHASSLSAGTRTELQGLAASLPGGLVELGAIFPKEKEKSGPSRGKKRTAAGDSKTPDDV